MGTMGNRQLGTLERLEHKPILDYKCSLDALVGWQRVPGLRLAWLDRGPMVDECAVDDVEWVHS
jgi:hypothetical protein